MSLTEMQVE